MKKKVYVLSLLAMTMILSSCTAAEQNVQTTPAQETVISAVTETESAETAAETSEQITEAETTETAETTGEKETEKFTYKHDPRDNPEAMKDIIENPDAVYGFAPSPESQRLGSYAAYDWTDAEIVETGRQDRIAYHESIQTMYAMLEEMNDAGNSVEEIARAVSAERNRIRLASCSTEDELAATKASNLETYGDENGPSADSLFEKYGSWEMVMVKAFSTNMGMDACTGLYDDYYQFYVDMGLLPE